MKKSILSILLAIGSISTASAYDIHNGRVLNYTQTTTKNSNLRIIENDTKADIANIVKTNKHAIMDNKSNIDGILLKNKVNLDEVPVAVGEETSVNASEHIVIENINSTVSKTYRIVSELCNMDNLNCVIKKYRIQLDPNGYFELNAKRSALATFDKPGYKNVIITTSIAGENSDVYFTTDDSDVINVVDAK